MARETCWTADKEQAARKLIRETIGAAGAHDPGAIPHRVRERIKELATGEIDVDDYVKRVLAEERRKR